MTRVYFCVQIISALDKRFGIAAGAEISMEADPGTFDAERLREYMDLGLSRFSIGVQALFPSLIISLYRPARRCAASISQ